MFPKWTIIYHTRPVGSKWVGSAFEFFDNDSEANARYEELKNLGLALVKRPFNRTNDAVHISPASLSPDAEHL